LPICPGQRGIRRDRRGRLEPIHPGHLRIEHDEREWPTGSSRTPQHFDGLTTATSRRRTHAPVGKASLEDLSIHGVVIDDERGAALEPRITGLFRTRRTAAQHHGEVKRAALTWLALVPDTSAHHRDERGRDAESEARAAKSPRHRSVGLAECLEHTRLMLVANPDA